jgi:hypothetical protein
MALSFSSCGGPDYKVDAWWGSLYYDKDKESHVFYERNPVQKKNREEILTEKTETLVCIRPDEYAKIEKELKRVCRK